MKKVGNGGRGDRLDYETLRSLPSFSSTLLFRLLLVSTVQTRSGKEYCGGGMKVDFVVTFPSTVVIASMFLPSLGSRRETR